ncbi:MAG: UvrB/UvrC motif-containing protein, partial [Planctomycetes bacterium]|nr:UvrB/UvrC motif-containing protein [Planctomycetota bacterium]
EVFKDILDDVLERIHGTDQHLLDARETELVRLNEEMAEAISKENYEVAGELKLRIQELESSLEGSDSLDF